MKSAWILLAMVASVWSEPLSDISELSINNLSGNGKSSGNIVENALWDLIDQIWVIIENGSDTLPPLDPLHVNKVVLDDETIPLPGAKVVLKNITVLNLGSLKVDLRAPMTSLIPPRYRIFLDADIPVLEASAGHYDINLSALGFNIYGAGTVKLKIINPRISANLLIGLRISGGIFVNLIETTVKFDLDGFEPQITGLFDHDPSSDFVSLFLKDLVPTLVDVYETEITNFLSTNIHQRARDFLADFDLSDLI